MDDSLIDDDTVPLVRRSLLPGEGFFVPDSVDDVAAQREAREALADADRVVVADPDADGLACVALLRAAFGEAALLPASPHDIADALGHVVEFGAPGLEVYVCDLCPDSEYDIEPLPAVTERASTVRWFDHHQWDDELAATVREHAELVVGESDEECTADVTLRTLEREFADRYAELSAVTRDHDLWLRGSSRSQRSWSRVTAARVSNRSSKSAPAARSSRRVTSALHSVSESPTTSSTPASSTWARTSSDHWW